MDFVHEDMSLMSQEMDRWRALQKVKVSAADFRSNESNRHIVQSTF